MFGCNIPQTIIHLQNILREGHEGIRVVHAQVYYSNAKNNQRNIMKYETGSTADFVFDGSMDSTEDYSTEDQIVDFIRTVQALNYCFDTKIEIVFSNRSTLVWRISQLVKQQGVTND